MWMEFSAVVGRVPLNLSFIVEYQRACEESPGSIGN